MKIGIIGADTSHALEFTVLLNDPSNPHHISGANVVQVYPGGSPDFALSASRVNTITTELHDKWGLEIIDSPELLAEHCDAILLLAVDGRVHAELFERIAPFGNPIFIDKPFAINVQDALNIAQLAKRYGNPIMSGSAVPFDEAFTSCLGYTDTITGADIYGPMALESTQNDLFWYGIHSAELLFSAMGSGCQSVEVQEDADGCTIIGRWENNRIGTIRGRYGGKGGFSASIHRPSQTDYIQMGQTEKPMYASLLEHVIHFFQTGKAPYSITNTIEVVRFLERANESRQSGAMIAI